MNCCKNCLGCQLLENPLFKGKEQCENFCKANNIGIEKCWKILKGDQLKI